MSQDLQTVFHYRIHDDVRVASGKLLPFTFVKSFIIYKVRNNKRIAHAEMVAGMDEIEQSKLFRSDIEEVASLNYIRFDGHIYFYLRIYLSEPQYLSVKLADFFSLDTISQMSRSMIGYCYPLQPFTDRRPDIFLRSPLSM